MVFLPGRMPVRVVGSLVPAIMAQDFPNLPGHRGDLLRAMKRTREDIADELLVMRCQDGDAVAFEELVARWQEPLRRHAAMLTGRREGGREVAQEAWLGIIRGMDRLRDPARFKPWAYRIVRNKAANWVRRRGRSREREERLAADPPADPPREAGGEEVRLALRKLPADLRTVLALHYLDELPLREIAARLDVPVGTVKSRLHYARERLRDTIERTSHE
jgi:RNA polymerase sigma-70 factor (ECF subfamily)